MAEILITETERQGIIDHFNRTIQAPIEMREGFIPKNAVIKILDMFEPDTGVKLVDECIKPYIDGIRKAVNMLPTIEARSERECDHSRTD